MIQKVFSPFWSPGPLEPDQDKKYIVLFKFYESTNILDCKISALMSGILPFKIADSNLDISPVYDLTNVELYVGYPDESKYTGDYSRHDVYVTTGGIANL